MPVYNRARALEAVMPTYLNQAHVRAVVLVDDGSTDATPEVMQAIASGSPVPVTILHHATRRGQPQSRLDALEAVQTEWVLFGEDDVALAPDYTATLVEQARMLNGDILAGRLVNVPVNNTFDVAAAQKHVDTMVAAGDPGFDWAVFRADYDARPQSTMPAPFLHTVALIRRRVFDAATFDPDYGGNAIREETDFYLSAARAGFRLFFVPQTVCFHLRGAIAHTGGQRMARWRMEFWNLVNTRRLVYKHWAWLVQAQGFRGSPGRWMLGYVGRRYVHVLRHIFARRTLRPKNQL